MVRGVAPGIPLLRSVTVNNRTNPRLLEASMNLARRSRSAALLLLGLSAAWVAVNPPPVAGAEPECLGAAATIVGDNDAAPGDGTITGTDGDDIIVGTEGDDVIDGGGGDDRICGLGGADTLTGGDGFDRLNGGPDTDTCTSEREVNCENVTTTDPGADPGAGPPEAAPGPDPGPDPAPDPA